MKDSLNSIVLYNFQKFHKHGFIKSHKTLFYSPTIILPLPLPSSTTCLLPPRCGPGLCTECSESWRVGKRRKWTWTMASCLPGLRPRREQGWVQGAPEFPVPQLGAWHLHALSEPEDKHRYPTKGLLALPTGAQPSFSRRG